MTWPTTVMQRRAFTLLELLVVMAIVSVLALLGLGAAGGVKDHAQAAQCVSNLRQLATANLAYAADNEARYVTAQDITNTVRWHGTRDGDGSPFDPTKGPLAPYLGTEGRVKLCPTLRDALKGTDTFEEGTGGYGYNAVYVGGTARDIYIGERMANVPRVSLTVMFTDTAFPRANGLQEYAYCEPFRSIDAAGRLRGVLSPSVHFRHASRANVAWCDGHVSGETSSQLGTTNSYGGDAKKTKIGWFGPNAENGFWNPARSYGSVPGN